jgi:hypothetical protein
VNPFEKAKAFLGNEIMKRLGIVPEAQIGGVNPTYPAGDPRYGRPVMEKTYIPDKGRYEDRPASLTPLEANTLELRRNMVLDRDGMQMYPGYDERIDEIIRRERAGYPR